MMACISTRIQVIAAAATAVVFMLALGACSDGSAPQASTPPTFTPRPAPTPGTAAAQADELYGTFAPIDAAGEGESIVTLSAEVTQARSGIVRMKYEGTEPLVLWSLDAEGEKQMILIDTTIPLTGVDPARFEGETAWWKANEPPYALAVEADGSWELSVLPVSSAPPLESSGHGMRVYLYDGIGGAFSGHKSDHEVGMSVTELSLQFDGGSLREAVVEQRTDPDFVVQLSRGPSMLIVTHRGDWFIDIPIEEW